MRPRDIPSARGPAAAARPLPSCRTAAILTHDREIARQCARCVRVLDGVLSGPARAAAAAPAPA